MSLPTAYALQFSHPLLAAPPSDPQTEAELFRARGTALATKGRRERLHRQIARLREGLSHLVYLFNKPTEAQLRKAQIERLQGYPAYLLDDIGVARDSDGNLVFETPNGQIRKVFPAPAAERRHPAAAPEPQRFGAMLPA